MTNKNAGKRKNHLLFNIFGNAYAFISMAMIVCVFAFIIIVTLYYGWNILSWEFLTSDPNPSALHADAGGILTPIIGTIVLTVLGISVAFPFALATAIYFCFYASNGIFKTVVKSAVDILAGVPTIVIGMFALIVFTLPQMGFLSTLVDTRVNNLNGTMVVYQYGNSFVDVVFDSRLDIDMNATQSAEMFRDSFAQGLTNEGLSPDLISVAVTEGGFSVTVNGTEPLTLLMSTNDSVFDILGLSLEETIEAGQTKSFSIVESGIIKGTVRSYGRSFLVAGVTMAIMILPFVIKSMEEALKTVPQSYIDAALALGATKWRMIRKVALLAGRQGLVTGVILGMGRIVGDTAIVWLTLGGAMRMTGDQPWYQVENWMSTLRNSGSTLTTYIYFTSPAGEGNRFDVAFGASIVLIGIIVLLNIAASIIGRVGAQKNG
ncbi:MAG: ABC transporter permease subunit [Defluviitaleaceae bacterium]|nr:ABC transporter permease subunit [Defluviitaleaceae bacterium]